MIGTLTKEQRVEVTSLAAQRQGLLVNVAEKAWELGEYLLYINPSLAAQLESLTNALSSHTQDYLVMQNSDDVYSLLKKFAVLLKSKEFVSSKVVETKVNDFLEKMKQLDFWFDQLKKSDSSSRFNWNESSSSLFSKPSSSLSYTAELAFGYTHSQQCEVKGSASVTRNQGRP